MNIFIKIKKNKKSQVELFGLAVFVMLIIIGLMVYVSLKRDIVESKENFGVTKYLDNTLSQEILALLLDTSVNKTNIVVSQLLRSHIRKKTVFELSRSTEYELDIIMNNVVNKTLVENGYDYFFFASSKTADELCVTNFANNCNISLLPTGFFGSYETYYKYGNPKICFCGFDYKGTPGIVEIQLGSNVGMGNIYIYLMIESTKLAED